MNVCDIKLKNYNLLVECICENASIKINIEDISDDTKLIEELEYDSITLMQLLINIEDEFEIDLCNDNLLADNLNTPAKLWKIIQNNMKSTCR